VATKKKTVEKEKRAQWVAVVTALIRRQGKILVGRRPEGGALPDVWEFPGGKIEAKESPEDALQRELKEELGIDAEIGKLQFAGTFTYGRRGLLFLFYDVKFWKGEIKAEHHTDLQWISPKDLTNLALPDANRAFLDKILPLL
jgi:8-oxo-dGTP diphosphatase